MALWDIYVEYWGFPIYATLNFPDTYDEDDVWEAVHQDIEIQVNPSG